jgi:hypothetical protein
MQLILDTLGGPTPFRSGVLGPLNARRTMYRVILRTLVISTLIAVVAVFVYFRGSVGDLRGPSARLATAHSRSPFNHTDWISGNAQRRGEMLADLMTRHNFVGIHRDSVMVLLGKSDCYAVQDGWPCYTVRLGKRTYQLGLLLNDPKNPGHVSAVGLDRTP